MLPPSRLQFFKHFEKIDLISIKPLWRTLWDKHAIQVSDKLDDEELSKQMVIEWINVKYCPNEYGTFFKEHHDS
jgi:hypothetical protein